MRASSVALVAAIALGACGPDSVPFEIEFRLQTEGSNRCDSDSCENVEMACDAAVMVRIADPDDPSVAYVSECFHVFTDRSLCSLANIQLPQEQIPNEMVLVQVVVWNWDDLSDQQQRDLDCPQGVTFNLSNVPDVPVDEPTPALGGQAYFQVGSSPTAGVTIQCMNINALNTDECEGFQSHITARVMDMSLPGLIDVATAKADDLDVAMVGPTIETGTGEWIVDSPDDVFPMPLAQIQPAPRWEGDLTVPFPHALCIQVFDNFDTGRVTILCVPPDDTAVLKEGVLIPTSVLNKIVGAIGDLPASGSVVGVVLNAGGAPAAGVQVTPTNGTVRYLNEDLTSTEDGTGMPLTATTSSGAFVSTDATFGIPGSLNEWGAKDITTPNGPNEQKKAIGGRVVGKVTFVKLQLKPPP